MTLLKKVRLKINRHIWSRLLLWLFMGFIIAITLFVLLWGLCHELSYNYLLDSDIIKKSERSDINDLQEYVDKNQVKLSDTHKMQKWCMHKNVRYLCMVKNNQILFDMGYTSVLNAFNGGVLDATLPFSYQVKFRDGYADIYIDTGIIGIFFSMSILIPALIAAVCWIWIFVKHVKIILNRVLEIRNVVQCYADGNLKKEVIIDGEDEFSELSRSLNKMRETLIAKDKANYALKKSQNELMIGMSHDLRTPLTSMMNYTELIKQSGNLDMTIVYAEKMRSKIILMRDLSDKMFQYFLLQRDASIQLNRPESASSIIKDYMSELCAMLQEEGFRIHMESADFGDGKVIVSDEFMGRINDNILSNIEKYAVPGSNVFMKITSDEQMVNIVIENQRNSTHPSNEGSGIGIKNIILMMEKMNGKCVVQMKKDIFTIELLFGVVS